VHLVEAKRESGARGLLLKLGQLWISKRELLAPTGVNGTLSSSDSDSVSDSSGGVGLGGTGVAFETAELLQ
jgi:hypothetical protein